MRRDRTVVLLVSFRGYIKEIPAAGDAAIAPPPTAQWWDVIDEVCKNFLLIFLLDVKEHKLQREITLGDSLQKIITLHKARSLYL